MEFQFDGDQEKMQRVKSKVEKFIAEDLAPELMGTEISQKFEQTLTEVFKKESIPNSISSLAAFIEGFNFAMTCHHETGHEQTVMVHMIAKTILKNRKEKLSKEVDKTISNMSAGFNPDTKI